MPDVEPNSDELIQAIAAMRTEVDHLIDLVATQFTDGFRGARSPVARTSEPESQRADATHCTARSLPATRRSAEPVEDRKPSAAGASDRGTVSDGDTDQRLDALARRLEGHLRHTSQRKSRSSEGETSADGAPYDVRGSS